MPLTRRKFLAGLALGAGGLCAAPALARQKSGGLSSNTSLAKLAEDGVGAQRGRDLPACYRTRLDDELALMVAEGWEPYLHFVHRLARSARESGFVLGPGGGACPGSLVLFGLGVTGVDPVVNDLIFERWFRPGNEPWVNLNATPAGVDWLTERLLREGARWKEGHFGPSDPSRLLEWDRPEGAWLFTLTPWRATEAFRARLWKLEFSPEAYSLLSAGGLADLEREHFGPYGGSLTRQEWQELRPTRFEHVVAGITLSSRGPRKQGRLTEYLDRRQARSSLVSGHPVVDEVTEKTHGLLLYQEQMMEIVHRLADLSLREADDWRRAFGKRKASTLEPLRARFVARAKQLADGDARRLFDDLVDSAGWTYCRAHEVSTAAVLLAAAEYRLASR